MKKLLIIILSLFLASSCWATTYYVANAGDDDLNDGLSIGAPWKTIAKVNAATFSAGDSVLFNRGDTWGELLTISSSGSSGSPITFAEYGTGNLPIIHGITMTTKNYINLSNLELHRTTTTRALTVLGCTNLILDGLDVDGEDIDDTAQGNLTQFEYTGTTWTEYVIVRNCTVHNAGHRVAATWGGGLKFNKGTRHFTVTNCTAYDNAEVSIQTYSDNESYRCSDFLIQNCVTYTTGSDITSQSDCPHGINVGAKSDDVIVENCYSYNSKQPLAIDGDCNRATLRNNIVVNGFFGIRVMANDLYGNTDSCNVFNNTVITTNSDAITGIEIFRSGSATLTNTLVKNNIVSTTVSALDSIHIDSDVTTSIGDINYNCYYNTGTYNLHWKGTTYTSFTDWKTNSEQDANGISQDPLFISSSDYHLQAGSPCERAGTNTGAVSDDYDGVTRVFPCDIGAYESVPKIRSLQGRSRTMGFRF